MKKYHVYAIGNALVDMEFSINDDFLSQHNIDKGVMTLVDETQQGRLYDALKELPGKKAGGGSAANTIMAVNQFGGTAFYSCKVANDETGDFYLKELNEAGVDTNLGNVRDAGITGKCLVMVTPDAERTMLSFLGISETVAKADLDAQAIAKAQYCYLEGYLVTSDTGRAAAIEARNIASKHGVKTALTLSDPNMVTLFKDGLNEMIGDGVDLLFCNEQEALLWSNTDTVDAAADHLKKIAKQFVITRGAEGAMLYDGTEFHSIAGNPVEAIDSNGAGDMFAGAFMYALSEGKDFVTAGNFAALAASHTVRNFGPRLTSETHQDIKTAFNF